MSVLINTLAILGLACTILGVLVTALFFSPALRKLRRKRRFIRRECADLAALDHPVAFRAALRKTGREGREGKAA